MGRGTEDGKWSTVAAGGRDLMRHIPAADKVLQSLVRHELSGQYGVEFARSDRTDIWEVASISDGAIQQFSKRRVGIVEILKEYGIDTVVEASRLENRQAGEVGRVAKPELTGAAGTTLREHWWAEADQAGLDVPGMAHDAIRSSDDSQSATSTGAERTQESDRAADNDRPDIERMRDRLADPETGLTGHQRRFSALQAMAAVADELPQGAANVEELKQLTQTVLDDPRFPTVAGLGNQLDSRIKDGSARLDHSHLSVSTLYTTADVPAAERRIAAFANRHDGRQATSEQNIRRAIGHVEAERGYTLGQDQVDALLRVGTSTAPLDTIVGPPGTGKTAMLAAGRQAWESAGLAVAGVTTAGKAALGLEAESGLGQAGIPSGTVADLLTRAQNGNPLENVDVLVLDEASLTDDRSRARIYQLADQADTKMVEIGDPKQLPGVGIGSSFGVVHQAISGPQLAGNRRQHHAADRQALDAWRDHRFGPALESMLNRGRLRTFETTDQAHMGMLADWRSYAAGAADPHQLADGLLMLSHTNDGVRRLNDGAQTIRAQHGELGESRSFAGPDGDRRFAVGDLVVFRQPDRDNQRHTGPDLVNGIQAVITGFTDNKGQHDGVQVEWRHPFQPNADRQTATIGADYIRDGGLDLGYALTVHRAEGATIGGQWHNHDSGKLQRGIVLNDGTSPHAFTPQTAYTAMTRARDETRTYTSLEGLQTAEQAAAGRPDDRRQLNQRIVTAAAEHATSAAVNRDDQPVLPSFTERASRTVEAGRTSQKEPGLAYRLNPRSLIQQAARRIQPIAQTITDNRVAGQMRQHQPSTGRGTTMAEYGTEADTDWSETPAQRATRLQQAGRVADQGTEQRVDQQTAAGTAGQQQSGQSPSWETLREQVRALQERAHNGPHHDRGEPDLPPGDPRTSHDRHRAAGQDRGRDDELER
jgi:ATP-dependent exoDNAse (exonuclease V) alpha subunit